MKQNTEIKDKLNNIRNQIQKAKRNNPNSEVYLRGYLTALNWVLEENK